MFYPKSLACPSSRDKLSCFQSTHDLPQESMLGHSEQVNERHYNYSTADDSMKLQALSQVSSKVIKLIA